eukprot:771339-Prymnesium_polylepis.2
MGSAPHLRRRERLSTPNSRAKCIRTAADGWVNPPGCRAAGGAPPTPPCCLCGPPAQRRDPTADLSGCGAA